MVTIASMFRNKSPDKNRYVDRGEIRADTTTVDGDQQLSTWGDMEERSEERERSLSRQAAPIACSVHRPFLVDTTSYWPCSYVIRAIPT